MSKWYYAPPIPVPALEIALVPLGHGRFAIIDLDDADRVGRHNWSCGKHNRYATASIDGRNVYLHRYIHGDVANVQVDHISGVRLDYRKTNLRSATALQNWQNRRKQRNTSSQYKGVSWSYSARRWIARIGASGKRYIGRFTTEREAALAYDKEAKLLYGEFAACNFPRTD